MSTTPERPAFTDEQRARATALDAACAVLSKRTGFASGELAADVVDVVDLAEYILTGEHPLDRVRTVAREDR
jgi:hypothetical protein